MVAEYEIPAEIAQQLDEMLDEKPERANPGVRRATKQENAVARRLRAIAQGKRAQKIQRLLLQAKNL
jgi:hypothetical protein